MFATTSVTIVPEWFETEDNFVLITISRLLLAVSIVTSRVVDDVICSTLTSRIKRRRKTQNVGLQKHLTAKQEYMHGTIRIGS